MSDYTPTTQKVEDRYWFATVDDEGVRLRAGEETARAEFRAWLAEHDAKVRAEAIREYVTAARENPHTYYWPPSGVLDDAEQWADEIEKGTI